MGIIDSLKAVGNCIWPLVKPHFDYWWCFDGNVQGLRDEIRFLEIERSNMNQKIEEARLRAESSTAEFENWWNEGTRKLEEATTILQGCVDPAPPACDIKSRYLAGKSAKETTEGIARLRNEGNSIRIADPARPASMAPDSPAPTLEFQSRKSIEEDILKSLKDDNVHMVAICGAGGVGKTTMAQRIKDRVRKEKLFDEIVTVVVSQPIDMYRIQTQIAEVLKLSLSENTSRILDGRAYKLHTRLMDLKKKLIIFDDVWKSFKLKDIGVPYGGCKIMLTSRLKNVCKEMDDDNKIILTSRLKIIEIQVLDNKEAWTLFSEKIGKRVHDSDLCPIAKDVAEECKGLPIALVTVGEALKERDINIWKDALLQLGRADPDDFPKLLQKVYTPLKLSYDFLETESEKSLFLLCCLFPEDYNISIEELALLSFGLGMFKGIDNIEEGRNRTYHLLERLRSRFLLMTGMNEYNVKMHDVVRDVAIFIGSKEKEGFLKSLQVPSKDSSINCNWMSISNAKFPIELDFPNLRLLMILNSTYFEFLEGFYVNDIDFKGMKELTVLVFKNQNFQSLLPSSLKYLKTLRKLHLECCKVRDISVVGELTSLAILRVWDCNEIEELSADFGKLKFLRLLQLLYCKRLERIAAGVISSLVGLEELRIVGCFKKWGAKGNGSEERNASLSELECLHNLTFLDIEIFDGQYWSRVGKFTKRERKITLHLPREITLGDWIRQQVKNTQFLELDGDGSNYIELGEIESLRELEFRNCSTVKKLVNEVDCKFPMLERLMLLRLQELEEIIDGTIPEGSNSFQNLESIDIDVCPKLGYLWKSPNQNVCLVNLKSIHIRDCHNLRYLFSMETERSLVQLESLQIYECEKMEQVLWNEMESSNTEVSIIEFPKLKKLELYSLPNLLGFTQLGVEIVKFPQLKELDIKMCPRLRTKIDEYPTCMIEKLVVCNRDTVEEIFRDDGNRHIIFQELIALKLMELPCLTTLCRGVESIKFPKLKVLWIENLPMLNSFVEIQDSEHTHDHHSLHFFCNKKVDIIGLKTLYLQDLPDKISNIWCRHIPLSFFHNLKRLYIDKGDGIKNLFSSSIAKALVNLKKLDISSCKEAIDAIEDETHITVTFVLPKLENLYIKSNCKLRSFCQWKHAFELPSLEEVEIVNCPLMKTFTLGLLSTPKLRRFSINYVEIEIKDLNVGIHHFISTETASEDEDEDEIEG